MTNKDNSPIENKATTKEQDKHNTDDKAGKLTMDELENKTAEQLTDEQREELEETVKKIQAAVTPAVKDSIKELGAKLRTALQGISDYAHISKDPEIQKMLRDLYGDFEETRRFLKEWYELEPYLREELKKDKYRDKDYNYYLKEYTPRELLEKSKDPTDIIAEILNAASEANAELSGAIMGIKNDTYSIFSNKELWNAFAPGRIIKMGEPIKKFIDEKTGRVNKAEFLPEDFEAIKDPAELSYQAYILLNSIINNSVDDAKETPIEDTDFYKNDGKLRFYVKGVMDTINHDSRSLLKSQNIENDQQLDINRKTAGALYLEKLFEPLQSYIGTMDNGSRWSVFNYVGYDAETDIMTVQTPYLYQLMILTQSKYFTRRKNREAAQIQNKKPNKSDLKPLELNTMFKGAAYNEDQTILEIAVYITNVMLTAGSTTKPKTTKIKYSTIIKNCPRLKARIENLQELPIKYTDQNGQEHKRNKSALYNTELRKIARAFDIIQNLDECSAREQYEFIKISPASKSNTGIFKLTAPTKSMLQDQIIIVWHRIKDTEEQ